MGWNYLFGDTKYFKGKQGSMALLVFMFYMSETKYIQ